MDTVAGYMAQSNSSFPFIKVVDGQKEFDFTFFLFEKHLYLIYGWKSSGFLPTFVCFRGSI